MATHGMTQPQVSQLFVDFLRRQAAGPDIEPATGEVILHQASGVHPVDPRAAFSEATEAAEYLLPTTQADAFRLRDLKTPACWSNLVRAQDSNWAVPLCLGNFPQMIRDVGPFLEGRSLSTLHQKAGQPLDVGDLAEWGDKMLGKGRVAEALFAVAALRMARRFEDSEKLLNQVSMKNAPKGLVQNEQAALAWQRGATEEARKRWAEHTQPQSPAVLFNRGLSALFADQPREAGSFLMQAVNLLPEKSGWHHLGRFYLIVAGNQAASR